MGKHVQGTDLALFGESRAIPIFLLTTLLISSVFYFLIIKSGHMGGGWGAYVAGLMWSPGFAALLTCKLLRRDLGSIGWGWGKTRYEVIGYLIPLGYSLVIYTFVWLTGLGGFYSKSFVGQITNSFGLGPIPAWASITLYFIFTATFTVIRDFATVIGEEIGWRGFLVPELAKKHGFPATAMITGFIWAIWHYPVILFADYHGASPAWFYVPLLTVMLPFLTFVWTWLRLKSKSIWPCVLLHASHNTFIQQFFDPLTIYRSKTGYVAGEFGAALLVISIAMAIYLWRRRDEVEGDRLLDSPSISSPHHLA
jgi:membrane protease YdiL (CAAX protease family)